MAEKHPILASAVMWALCLLITVAAVVLGPVYLFTEVPAAEQARADYSFLDVSHGWSREILAVLHVVFLIGMLGCAMVPAGVRLVRRMTGLSVLLGIWEILLSLGAAFLTERVRLAPPHMTLTALGALLLLGGIGLNLDAIFERLTSPKTPVVLIFTVASAVGVIAFALIGSLNVRHYARVDYTRAGRYSLPPATVKLLEQLRSTVKITTVFVVRELKHDALKREVTDILEEYARVSPRVEVRHLELRREPKAVKELIERLKARDIRLEENAVIFECEDTGRVMQVASHEMIQTVAPERSPRKPERRGKGKEEPLPEQPTTRFLGDRVFHQVLSIVAARKTTKLYFVVGHGEKPEAVGPPTRMMQRGEHDQISKVFGTDFFEAGLRRRYYRVETINLDMLDESEGIPEDCDVLVISGPWCTYMASRWGEESMQRFTRKQAGIVRKYLERGGRAFIMIDPVSPFWSRMVSPLLKLLGDYGVGVDVDQVVGDWHDVPQPGPYGTMVVAEQPTYRFFAKVVKDVKVTDTEGEESVDFHPSIRALRAWPMIFAVECAAMTTKPVSGLRHARILATSRKGWLQPLPGPAQAPEPADPKKQARRIIAVAVEKAETGDPVLVVLGSSNMFIQWSIRYGKVADNEEFAQQVLAWLAGSAEELTVEPKATEVAYGEVDAGTIRTLRFTSVGIIPSIFILVGVLIWLSRRR